MKKRFKLIAVLLCAVMITALSFGQKTMVRAADKTKVVMKYHYKNSKQYAVFKGKRDGQIKWVYKTKKRVSGMLDNVGYIIKGDNVYIMDCDTYIRLNRNSGKVKVKKNTGVVNAGPRMVLDNSDNLYSIGADSSTLIKVNNSGKLIWKSNLGDFGGACRIELSGGRVYVYSELEYSTVIISMSTGELVDMD